MTNYPHITIVPNNPQKDCPLCGGTGHYLRSKSTFWFDKRPCPCVELGRLLTCAEIVRALRQSYDKRIDRESTD